MRPFHYEALNTKGQTRTGIISADNSRSARQELKQKGLIPVKVQETEEKQKLSRDIEFGRSSLSHKDLTLITRQMATLAVAALPLEEALSVISRQAHKPQVKKIILSVRAGVIEGHKLSSALKKESKSFDPLYRSMVAAGEASGDLGAVLMRLAGHMERAHEIRSQIRTALIYPAALFITALSVIVILMTYVVPKVVNQFGSLGQELPFLTRVMIGISDFLGSYGLYMLAGLVILSVSFMRLLKREKFKLACDRFLLSLPLIGRLIRDVSTARLTRTLAVLLASGTPLLDALKASVSTQNNLVLRAGVTDVARRVEEGTSLSTSLTPLHCDKPAAAKEASLFPPMVSYMAAAGENSGTLDTMLEKSADYLEREFNSFTTGFLSLLEPAIIIIMGLLVALIVLSILLPILQLNTLAAF